MNKIKSISIQEHKLRATIKALQFQGNGVTQDDIDQAIKEYADQQLNEFKRKLKEDIDKYFECANKSEIIKAFNEGLERSKSLIDKIEL